MQCLFREKASHCPANESRNAKNTETIGELISNLWLSSRREPLLVDKMTKKARCHILSNDFEVQFERLNLFITDPANWMLDPKERSGPKKLFRFIHRRK